MDGGLRGIKRLKAIASSDSFKHDLTNIRKSTTNRTTRTYAMIGKYGLSQSHFPIIEALVNGKPLDQAILTTPAPTAQIVNHNDRTIQPADEDPGQLYDIAEALGGLRTGISIHLNSDIGKEELIQFIEEHYMTYIQPVLPKHKRISEPVYINRDDAIRKLKKEGVSAQDLSDKYNISIPRVYQILKKL